MRFSVSEANKVKKVKRKFGLEFEPRYVLNIASDRKVEFGELNGGCIYEIPHITIFRTVNLKKTVKRKFNLDEANNAQTIKDILGLNHEPTYVLQENSLKKVLIGDLVEESTYKIEEEGIIIYEVNPSK